VSPPLAPLGAEAVHVVIDMQRLFAEGTHWNVPTLPDVLPPIQKLIEHRPERVVFTRFITPPSLPAAPDGWQEFYRHWPQLTQDRLPPGILDLVAPLAKRATPAKLVDKEGFSSFSGRAFHAVLRNLEAKTLVLSGVETDVCVLATAVEAVDRGYRVVVAADAVTSFSAAAHRAVLDHVLPRFEYRIDIASTAEILAAWK